jgi:uncharacterized protein (TIGR00369 family)
MTDIGPETDPADGRRKRPNPFATHLRLPSVTVSEKASRLEMIVEEIHLRPGGILHGGFHATVIDTVTGYAAYTVAPEGAEVVTMQLNLNMTATARLGDRIIATAKVAHAGRRTAVVTGEIRRVDGTLLATGSATVFFVQEGVS